MNRGTLVIAIATVMVFPCATADAQATLRVGSADGVEGEEVEVSILMDTDDGDDGAVLAGTMQVKHDGDVLRLEEIAPGEDLEGAPFFVSDIDVFWEAGLFVQERLLPPNFIPHPTKSSRSNHIDSE